MTLTKSNPALESNMGKPITSYSVANPRTGRRVAGEVVDVNGVAGIAVASSVALSICSSQVRSAFAIRSAKGPETCL